MHDLSRNTPESRPMGTRWIASVAAVALVVITAGSMALVSERTARRTLTQETERRLVLVGRDLAHLGSEALLGDFPELVLNPALREISQEQPELQLLVALDREGKIIGHTQSHLLDQTFELPEGLQPLQREGLLKPNESLLIGPHRILSSIPIQEGQHELGRVIIGLDRSYLQQRVGAARRAQLAVMGVLGLLGAVTALFTMSRLLRPLGALRRGLDRIAEGDLDTPIVTDGIGELTLLAGVVNDTAASLKSAREELIEKERLEYEMYLARRIQEKLLPASELRVGPYRIRGHQFPAREVGGDLYDVFALPEGRVGLVIADVCGKGLVGCLSASMLVAFVRAYRDSVASPAKLLTVLDQQLRTTLGRGSFVTMFYGILEPATGRLVFASAGHWPTAIYRAATRTVEWHSIKGTPLAASRNPEYLPRYQESETTLDAGDTLVQYTDGINESSGPSQGQFGLQRLQELLQRNGHKDPASLVRDICAEVERWRGGNPRHDDETLLVLSNEGAQAAPLRPATLGTSTTVDLVAEARRRGRRIVFPANLRRLREIKNWLKTCPWICELDRIEFSLVRTGLYEICSNIVEHGYGEDEGRVVELLWLPPNEPSVSQLDPSRPEHRARAVRAGRFLIVDNAESFDLTQVEITEAPVDQRGRGFGLRMIRGTLNDLRYEPNTSEGNVTLASFDPQRHWLPQEVGQ